MVQTSLMLGRSNPWPLPPCRSAPTRPDGVQPQATNQSPIRTRLSRIENCWASDPFITCCCHAMGYCWKPLRPGHMLAIVTSLPTMPHAGSAHADPGGEEIWLAKQKNHRAYRPEVFRVVRSLARRASGSGPSIIARERSSANRKVRTAGLSSKECKE
jgi:hypothetical protein